MPKMKTNSSAKKRFKVTGSGKIKKYKAYKSHLLGHKSTKQKRHLNIDSTVHPSDESRVKAMLTIGK